jgi:hypothetical protein
MCREFYASAAGVPSAGAHGTPYAKTASARGDRLNIVSLTWRIRLAERP